MIQMRTWLDVADNTGAKLACCIKVLGRGNSRIRRDRRHHRRLGQEVAALLRDQGRARWSAASIVRTRNNRRRADGSYVRFDSNAIVLVDEEQEPARHAHLRRRRPRAPAEGLHEDRLARAGGRLMARIRKGDTGRRARGRRRGQARPRAARAPADASRAVVEGVNLVYKHLRKSQKNPQGGRVRREAPIHALASSCSIDPTHRQAARACPARSWTARSVRVARKSGAVDRGRGQGRAKRAKAEA